MQWPMSMNLRILEDFAVTLATQKGKQKVPFNMSRPTTIYKSKYVFKLPQQNTFVPQFKKTNHQFYSNQHFYPKLNFPGQLINIQPRPTPQGR